MKTNRLTQLALLTAIALIISLIEAQFPLAVPIPGIKLGLANIVTVYAMFIFGPKSTFIVLLARILLAGIFSGRMLSFSYSFVGGLCCFATMLLLRKLFSQNQIWICSILGALSHVIGQVALAIIVTGTYEIIGYLPILMLSAIVTGCATGVVAQTFVRRMPIQTKENNH